MPGIPQGSQAPWCDAGHGEWGGWRVRQGSTFFITAILLSEKDYVGFLLCYSVNYNSVVLSKKILLTLLLINAFWDPFLSIL